MNNSGINEHMLVQENEDSYQQRRTSSSPLRKSPNKDRHDTTFDQSTDQGFNSTQKNKGNKKSRAISRASKGSRKSNRSSKSKSKRRNRNRSKSSDNSHLTENESEV